ncbi:MAG: glycosyltransferase, partial [Thermoleophilia bacterium]|nr:glycosyltransferase [Thermoleophilia bacterium]
KYKGIDTAITALSRTGADRRPGAEPIRVICVGDTEGDPDYGEAVRRHCREAGVEDRFELLGWVSDERLGELQGEVAATLCPSTYEGYGLSVTEGLAAGLPALVSDIPPHRETAGDAGLYFEPGDADRLAQLLEEVGSDPERRVGLAWNSRDRHAELVAAERPWAVAIRSALTELP